MFFSGYEPLVAGDDDSGPQGRLRTLQRPDDADLARTGKHERGVGGHLGRMRRPNGADRVFHDGGAADERATPFRDGTYTSARPVSRTDLGRAERRQRPPSPRSSRPPPTPATRSSSGPASRLVGADTDAVPRHLPALRTAPRPLISIGPNGGNGPYHVLFGGIFAGRDPGLLRDPGGVSSAGDTDGACPDTSEPPLYILLCFDVYERSAARRPGSRAGQRSAQRLVRRDLPGGRPLFFQTTEALLPSRRRRRRQDVYERFAGSTNLISQGPAVEPARTQPSSWLVHGRHPCVLPDLRAAGQSPTPTRHWLDVYERNAGATTLITTGPAKHQRRRDPDLERATRSTARVLSSRPTRRSSSGDTDAMGHATRARHRSPATRGQGRQARVRRARARPTGRARSANRTHGPRSRAVV